MNSFWNLIITSDSCVKCGQDVTPSLISGEEADVTICSHEEQLYYSLTIWVCHAKILVVVGVLTHSVWPEGECTMCQNPDYYFGMAHSNGNTCTIIIIMLTVYW